MDSPGDVSSGRLDQPLIDASIRDRYAGRPEVVLPAERIPLGRVLLERGLVSEDDVLRALERQRETGLRVGDTLVELGAISGKELAAVLADHFGVVYVDLEMTPPDVMLSTLVPEALARRYQALPVRQREGRLLVAMTNPNDVFAIDDLRFLTAHDIDVAIVDRDQLLQAIDRTYNRSEVETTLDDAADDYEPVQDDAVDVAVEDGPVVRLVSALLEQAVADRASDLHIEPCAAQVRIRMRVDGVLHKASDAPLSVLRPLITRLKVLANLDIAQSRLPQDGRFSVKLQGRAVDVRVATTPTAGGEAAVLRLLDPVRGALDLASLGLSAEEAARFVPAFHAPQGAVFVTGPTGSGKSSTLYAMLSEINTIDKSIVSVEDPIEYRIDGIKQIQINTRAGMTFAGALRSILRTDPEVIMVGEVRDAETAAIAADASLTGHLVLSTLHTTRAATTPMRLIDMGVEPYLVASSLSCIIAQRLARKLCENCAEDVDCVDGPAALRDLGAPEELAGNSNVRVAVGCPACRQTGYQGRLALFEIMPVTEEISRLIVDRAASSDIEHLAIEQGMDTLRQAALRHVARGRLSINEMLRVVA